MEAKTLTASWHLLFQDILKPKAFLSIGDQTTHYVMLSFWSDNLTLIGPTLTVTSWFRSDNIFSETWYQDIFLKCMPSPQSNFFSTKIQILYVCMYSLFFGWWGPPHSANFQIWIVSKFKFFDNKSQNILSEQTQEITVYG